MGQKRKRADNVELDIPNAKRIDNNQSRTLNKEKLDDSSSKFSETPNSPLNVQKDIIPVIVSDDSRDASDGEAVPNKGEEEQEEQEEGDSSEGQEQDITDYLWGCRVCGEEYDERDSDAECYYHEDGEVIVMDDDKFEEPLDKEDRDRLQILVHNNDVETLREILSEKDEECLQWSCCFADIYDMGCRVVVHSVGEVITAMLD